MLTCNISSTAAAWLMPSICSAPTPVHQQPRPDKSHVGRAGAAGRRAGNPDPNPKFTLILIRTLAGPALLVDVPATSNITANVMRELAIPRGVRRVLFRTSNTARCDARRTWSSQRLPSQVSSSTPAAWHSARFCNAPRSRWTNRIHTENWNNAAITVKLPPKPWQSTEE